MNTYSPITHTVQPNETLVKIAQRYGTTVQAIVSANPSLSMGMIFPGQRLYIWPVVNQGDNSHAKDPVSRDEILSKNESLIKSEAISRAEFDLSNRIRILWEQHIAWTRLATISIVFDLPDASLVANRLLKNSEDFDSLLASYYGKDKASSFSNLLRGQLVLTVELINEVKSKDEQAASDTERRLYDNARNMAVHLGSFNPHWSLDEWEKMFSDYLALVKTQAEVLMNKKYQEGIDLYMEMEEQAMKMAHAMTTGIVKQFSEKFKV